MTKARLVALGAAVAALGAGAVPAQATWHLRTLTNAETFLRGVDARPDRVPMILDERVQGSRSSLELRIGSRATQTIATGRHSFGDVHVDHDDRGAPVVAWSTVPNAGGARQLFAWSAGAGAVQLTTGTQSTSLESLDVAGDGGAVLTGWSANRLVVARRTPGAQAFGAAVTVATDVGLEPTGAAGPGGRAVVAWTKAGALQVADAEGTDAFGPTQTIAVPPAPDGRAAFVDGVTLTATPTGRVVAAASTIPDPNGTRSRGRRVDTFDWAPGAAAPGPVQTISQAPFAGAPAILTRAEVVFVAWTETSAVDVGPRTIRVARFGPAGVAPSTTYTSSGHNVGYVDGAPVLQALPGRAVRAYYQPSRSARTYTVTFDENGRAGGAALVATRTNADLAAALTRDGSLVAWTRRLGTGNGAYRVQVATP